MGIPIEIFLTGKEYMVECVFGKGKTRDRVAFAVEC